MSNNIQQIYSTAIIGIFYNEIILYLYVYCTYIISYDPKIIILIITN